MTRLALLLALSCLLSASACDGYFGGGEVLCVHTWPDGSCELLDASVADAPSTAQDE